MAGDLVIAEKQLPPPVSVRLFGATGTGDETTQIRNALTYAKANRRGLAFQDGTTYTVDSLDLSFEGDTPDATIYGYRAVPIIGSGPRSTILQQAATAGATTPLLTVRGSAADSNTSHTGKVQGALIAGLELRGAGIASGIGHGIELSIFHFGAIRDVYVTEFGGDGIRLRRPERTALRDDYSHQFEVTNVKLFRNGGTGLRTPDDHAVGPGIITNVQASSNGGRGFDLIAAGITLDSCLVFANSGGGIRSRASQNGSMSFAQGLSLNGCRIEGNTGIEVELDGGYTPALVNTTMMATGGGTALSVGNGTAAVKGCVVSGGFISGSGGPGGTAGQKAIILGANVSSAFITTWIETDQFADAYAADDPMSVITNSGTNCLIWTNGAWRTAPTFRQVAGSNVALETRVFSESARRLAVLANGQMQWGDGTSAADTNLYRGAANRLKTDDAFWAVDGVVTKTKAGTPTDADFATTPVDGTMVIDTTASKIWVRVGGVWKSSALT
jgi:hypothetical protein